MADETNKTDKLPDDFDAHMTEVVQMVKTVLDYAHERTTRPSFFIEMVGCLLHISHGNYAERKAEIIKTCEMLDEDFGRFKAARANRDKQ